MFRIMFIAVGGEERETFVVADSEMAALEIAARRDEFDLLLTCTELDTVEDRVIKDQRRRFFEEPAFFDTHLLRQLA